MPPRAKPEREYGPLTEDAWVNGVTWDGQRIWFSSDEGLKAMDPQSGEVLQTLEVGADAGTAYDGRYLYQLAKETISKIDPTTGEVVATIPAPGLDHNSGMTWAEGALWIGQYRDRKILQLDPETGAIKRTLRSDRFVTGVTWSDGELWHATSEGSDSDLRRIDPDSGEVLERIEAPGPMMISGLTTDGQSFYCGGGDSRTIRKLGRP